MLAVVKPLVAAADVPVAVVAGAVAGVAVDVVYVLVVVVAAGGELLALPWCIIFGTSNASTATSTTERASAIFFVRRSFSARRFCILCLRLMRSLHWCSGRRKYRSTSWSWYRWSSWTWCFPAWSARPAAPAAARRR